MELFNIEFTSFFGWLVRSTIQASVLVCIILVIKALLGKSVGDQVEVQAPAGVLKYEILEIK